jgi:HD-GYP domain-containing protein (c-di-GMP phosphodiesterase class II)
MKITKASIPYTILVSTREIETGDLLAADCFTRRGQKVASEGEEVDDKLQRQMDNMGVRKAWLERRIPEWMPFAEAKLRNYDIIETHDVPPLHYQILTNFQGAFSTEGIDQLLDRISASDREISDAELQETMNSLTETVDRLKRKENKLQDKIEDLEDETLRERYYQLLTAAQPQAIDPSEIEEGKSALGRKVQGFLEKLNNLKNELSGIILGMSEEELIAFFDLENLGDYETTPDFADSFVLFERMYAQTTYADDSTLDKLFVTAHDLLHEMFYDRSLDEDKLRVVNDLLWNSFSPNIPHWFMALGQPGELESYLLAHSINTAILFSQIHQSTNKNLNNEPIDLTLACLVKDIGMVLVPQSYHLHQEDLSKEQQQKLNIHPLISREFLENISTKFPDAFELIETHHEKLDGTGYPRKTEYFGSDQQLLNICDMFDAMTSPRMWRPAIPPSDAMKYLREDAGRSLDTEWVNQLIREIGIFPVGTVVRLSNDQPSVVVENNRSHPDKPIVVPVSDLMQSDGDLTIIDLNTSDLSIQTGGTSRKAPLAIRQKFTQHDQISSRFIKPA